MAARNGNAEDGQNVHRHATGQPSSARRLWRWVTGLKPFWKWLDGVVAAIITGVIILFITRAVSGGGQVSPSTKSTAVRFVQVFNQAGELPPTYSVTQTFSSGECVASIGSSDPEALRCTTGNYLRDPCWQNPRGTLSEVEVACLNDPWSSEVVLIRNAKVDYPGHFLVTSIGPLPWALEIENPDDSSQELQCILISGTSDSIAGMRINWSCHMPGLAQTAGYAVGAPQIFVDKPWVIYYAAVNTGQVVQAQVTTVWR